MEHSELIRLCRELNNYQPELWMVYIRDGIAFSGKYKFHKIEPTYGIEIEDEYFLQIKVDFDYPLKIPKVYEVGDKIKKYSHMYDNKEFCLGVDSEIRLFLNQNCNLRTFIDTYVTNYLFNYSAYKKYGFLPLGERSHYNAGIREFYYEYFNMTNIQVILNILRGLVINKKVNQNEICACGSNKRIRNCHGEKMQNLLNAVPLEYLRADIISLEGK